MPILLTLPTPIAIEINISGSAPPFAFSFAGSSPQVNAQTGYIDLTGIPGQIEFTAHITSANAAFDSDPSKALVGRLHRPSDTNCTDKDDADKDSNHWQFNAPNPYGFTTIVVRYNHRKETHNYQSMVCNSYGLGFVINNTSVSLDPIIHN